MLGLYIIASKMKKERKVQQQIIMIKNHDKERDLETFLTKGQLISEANLLVLIGTKKGHKN